MNNNQEATKTEKEKIIVSQLLPNKLIYKSTEENYYLGHCQSILTEKELNHFIDNCYKTYVRIQITEKMKISEIIDKEQASYIIRRGLLAPGNLNLTFVLDLNQYTFWESLIIG